MCREQLMQRPPFKFWKMAWPLGHPSDLNVTVGRLTDWFWIHINRNAVRTPK
jgi:hypothetical protein